MHFLNLTQSAVFNPEEHLPLHLKRAAHKHQKGNHSTVVWTLVLESTQNTNEEGVAHLPVPYGNDRSRILEAVGGGLAFDAVLKKFSRSGKLSLVPLKDGKPAEKGKDGVDPVACVEEPCEIYHARLSASEGKVTMRWHVKVTSTSVHARQWVDAEGCDVHVAFKLSEGNTQIPLFGRPLDPELDAEAEGSGGEVDDVVEAEEVANGEPKPRRKTRRAGRRTRRPVETPTDAEAEAA